jgi:hypothetical protein
MKDDLDRGGVAEGWGAHCARAESQKIEKCRPVSQASSSEPASDYFSQDTTSEDTPRSILVTRRSAIIAIVGAQVMWLSMKLE